MTSERFNVGLIEVETMWSLDNVADAHAFLDAHEAATARAARAAETNGR